MQRDVLADQHQYARRLALQQCKPSRRPRGWSMWMKGLLKLAPNLLVLELRLLMCPPDLPIMGNLCHLNLDVAQIRGSPTLLSAAHACEAPCALLHMLEPHQG